MNYPTREEFEALKAEQRELKEEVRQLREQRTEEMKAINVNVASADVLTRLDDLKQELTQELKTVSDIWLETMQGNYGEHKADFLTLRESQADFRDRLNVTATKEDLSQLETRIDSKLAPINATLTEILDRLPPKQ